MTMAETYIHEGIVVFESNDRGRGVRASQSIRPGTCLVRENPVACVLFSQEFPKRCEKCLEKKEKLRICGGCNEVRYCSRKCQISGWADHQYECQYKKKNKHSQLPPWSSGRIIIRIIHQQKKRKCKSAREPSRNFPTTVEGLCDGVLSSNGEMKMYYSQTAANLFEFVSSDTIRGWNVDQISALYAKLQVNGFCLLDSETRKPIGEAIYTCAAVFNHSCSPNCCFVFNQSTIEVRSIREIQPGEECSINYVNLLKSTAKRQQDLYDIYGFWCDCLRCQQNQEDVDESSGDSLASDEAEQLGDKLLRNIEDAEITENHHEVLDLCHDAQSQLEPLLDQNHYIMSGIYKCATEACIQLQEWDQATLYGQRVIDSYRVHLNDSNPLIGFYKWRIARIQAGELGQPLAAKAKLQQAVDNLSIGHGSCHTVTIAAKEMLEYVLSKLGVGQAASDDLKCFNPRDDLKQVSVE